MLFAWEAGANLGHVLPLSKLMESLAGERVDACLAVRDLQAAQLIAVGHDVPCLQAPVWSPHTHAANEDGNGGYLDVLALLGFGDPAKLAAMLHGWRSLLSFVKPDLIVAEHSPALQVLARALGLPAIAIGTGFTLPPVVNGALPPLRADRGPLLPEARLAQSLKAALGTLSLAPHAGRLSQALFPGDRFALSLPELDVYSGWRQEELYLPLEELPAFRDPPDRPRLFAYLGNELPKIGEWVHALATVKCEVEVYLRETPAHFASFLKLRGVTVHDRPPPLAEVLPRVSHVLCQGGIGLCSAGLAAGRPIGVLPLHGESELNFHRLSMLGVAQRLPMEGDGDVFALALDQFIADHQRIVNALKWGANIALRHQPLGLTAVRERILARLDGAASIPAPLP